MPVFIAYLNFKGQCREAMEFYQRCFGGELVLQKMAESPLAMQLSSTMGAKILLDILSGGGLRLMASDRMGDMQGTSNSVTLCVYCDSLGELQTLFKLFAENGQVIEPLNQTTGGAMLGLVLDKFGHSWMVTYSKHFITT